MHTAVNIVRSGFLGLSLYHSYSFGRALIMGREEQRGQCTIHLIQELVKTTLLLSDTAQSLWGQRSAHFFKIVRWSTYVSMSGLYYITKKMEKAQQTEKQFLQLNKQFASQQGRSLGEKMVNDCAQNQERQDRLDKQFPKSGCEDKRSLATRINDAHKQSQCAAWKHRLYRVCDYIYMHMSNVIMLIVLSQSAMSIFFKHKMISNLFYIVTYGWVVAEQGMFLTKPNANAGLLYKIRGGDFVRAYSAIVSKVTMKIGFGFSWFSGIEGKIQAVAMCILQYVPFSTLIGIAKSILPPSAFTALTTMCDIESPVSKYFMDTPTEITDRKVEDNTPLACTKKMLTPLPIKDPCPEQSLEQMQLNIQKQLSNDKTLSDENRKDLEAIFGKDKKNGLFYKHVMATQSEEGKKEQEILVKTIFNVCTKKWDVMKEPVAQHSEDLGMCRLAVTHTIYTLYAKCAVDTTALSSFESTSKCIEHKILTILQQSRDVLFEQACQKSFVDKTEKQRQWVQALGGQDIESARERYLMSSEKSDDMKNLKDFSRIMSPSWLHSLQNYVFFNHMLGACLWIWKCFSSLGTSRHVTSDIMWGVGEECGLSGYSEAARDAESSLFAGFLKNIRPLIYREEKEAVLKKFHEDLIPMLIQVVDNQVDNRITFEEIACNLLQKITEEGGDNEESVKIEGWLEKKLEQESAERFNDSDIQERRLMTTQIVNMACVNLGLLIPEKGRYHC